MTSTSVPPVCQNPSTPATRALEPAEQEEIALDLEAPGPARSAEGGT